MRVEGDRVVVRLKSTQARARCGSLGKLLGVAPLADVVRVLLHRLPNQRDCRLELPQVVGSSALGLVPELPAILLDHLVEDALTLVGLVGGAECGLDHLLFLRGRCGRRDQLAHHAWQPVCLLPALHTWRVFWRRTAAVFEATAIRLRLYLRKQTFCAHLLDVGFTGFMHPLPAAIRPLADCDFANLAGPSQARVGVHGE